MDAFDALPISATINGKFFACHGGLSPDIITLEDINCIHRFQEIPAEGPLCDLLWADPIEVNCEDASNSVDANMNRGFTFNETRHCSYFYDRNAVEAFLERNNLFAIVRAHEACIYGYKFLFYNEETQLPRLITIFSAPNYCDVYKNKGSYLKLESEKLNVRQYVSNPHPYYLPNFMDVFA